MSRAQDALLADLLTKQAAWQPCCILSEASMTTHKSSSLSVPHVCLVIKSSDKTRHVKRHQFVERHVGNLVAWHMLQITQLYFKRTLVCGEPGIIYTPSYEQQGSVVERSYGHFSVCWSNMGVFSLFQNLIKAWLPYCPAAGCPDTHLKNCIILQNTDRFSGREQPNQWSRNECERALHSSVSSYRIA